MRLWKWFYPGIGLKRWIFLAILALLALTLGIISSLNYFIAPFIELEGDMIIINVLLSGSLLYGLIGMGLGAILLIFSLQKLLAKINTENKRIVDSLYKKKKLNKGSSVAALGGGTGLANLLRGLKHKTSNINAIVTVADDGGSSGKLRDELGMPPPGDIRNCLVALADTEPLMEELFQYRFSADGHLVGHSFGNLFIASMNQIVEDFEEAVIESSRVLAVRGQVLPATKENIKLEALYHDGSKEIGESVIPLIDKKIDRVYLKPRGCQASDRTISALQQAEIITVGPGSLYTSILPNLLIEDIVETIKTNNAPVVYICNVMTQPGETDGYNASDHVRAITQHLGEQIFDWIIVNRQSVPRDVARLYEEEGAFPVEYEVKKLKGMGLKVRSSELLQRKEEQYIRHDPQKLAEIVLKIAQKSSEDWRK